MQEHLAPIFPEFLAQFNPVDARFLGSPIDLIVFDGLDAGDVKRVVLVEVKTGAGNLTPRERWVRDAIKEGRVEYQLLRLPAGPKADEALSLPDEPEPPAAFAA